MSNVLRIALLAAAIIIFFIPKIHAQTKFPAKDQQKKTAPAVKDHLPRKNTDMPAVTESNKNSKPGKDSAKANPPATNDRTPRTFTDQPPIKEVPKKDTPAKVRRSQPQKNRTHPKNTVKGSPVKKNQ